MFEIMVAQGVVIALLCVLLLLSWNNTRRWKGRAQHDVPTGLYNREGGIDVFEKITSNRRSVDGGGLLMFIDLDQFKQINDTYGHKAGDRALTYVAHCLLSECKRATDLAIRYGGDEFVLILHEATSEYGLEVARRIVSCLQSYRGDRVQGIGVSIGVRPYRQDETTFEILCADADAAMYAAKGTEDRIMFIVRFS